MQNVAPKSPKGDFRDNLNIRGVFLFFNFSISLQVMGAKSKAMNTIRQHNDPNPSANAQDGGCCGGLGDWGCC